MSGQVTLTSAMRSNLLSLQNTAQLLATTQNRLATGKKVNSALDSPTAYFAAQSLSNRASDLSNLLDGMGQAIQTITAASQGITAAESVITQMTAVANSASTSLSSSTPGTTGSQTLSAGASAVAVVGAVTNSTSDMRSFMTNSKVAVGIQMGQTLTVQIGGANTYTFTMGQFASNNAGNSASASNGGGTTLNDLTTWMSKLEDTANNAVGVGLTISGGGMLTVTNVESTSGIVIGGSLATELGISGVAGSNGGTTVSTTALNTGTFTVTQTATTSTLLSDLTTAAGIVNVGAGGSYGAAGSTLTLGTNTLTMTSGETVNDLVSAINKLGGITASFSSGGGLQFVNNTAAAITPSGTAAGLFNNAAVANGGAQSASTPLYQFYNGSQGTAGSSSLANYTAQYDTLRTQLDQLVQDASYQGVNLIAASNVNPLIVSFNNEATNPNSLTISAVDLTSAGMGLKAANGNWSNSASITNSLSALTSANATLRQQSANLGTNLTTVQTRQTFTTNLINTLTSGAGALTNADTNTESANMLALQTQQQLGISSLSLASQAAQSVLKLFP
jgi:flagellin